jgi:hypothetical protein
LNPERAWRIWLLCEEFDWKFLPDEIERQDDLLMRDLLQIARAAPLVKESLEEDHVG